MKEKPDLKCRLDDGAPCPGGYDTCGHVCERVPTRDALLVTQSTRDGIMAAIAMALTMLALVVGGALP